MTSPQPRAYTTLMFQTLDPFSTAAMSPILADLRSERIGINQACLLTSRQRRRDYRSLCFVPVFLFADRVREYLSEVSPGFFEYEIYEDRGDVPNIQGIARYLNQGGFENLYLIPEDQREVILALDPLDETFDAVQEKLDALPTGFAVANWSVTAVKDLGMVNWTLPVRGPGVVAPGVLDDLASYRGMLIPAGVWVVHCQTEIRVILAVWPNDIQHIERVYGDQIEAGEIRAQMIPCITLEQDVHTEEARIPVWTAAERLFEDVGSYDEVFAHIFSCPANAYTAALAYGKRV